MILLKEKILIKKFSSFNELLFYNYNNKNIFLIIYFFTFP